MSISSDFVARNALVAALGACAVSCSSPDPAKPSERYVKIDDMEGTSGRIEWRPDNEAPDAVPGHWLSYADVACENLEPIPEAAGDGTGGWSYAELPQSYETLPGVTSTHAARLRTIAPLPSTWGAGMGFYFSELPPGTETIRAPRPCTQGTDVTLEQPLAPVDLSPYSSLVFWGMARKDAGRTTLLVLLQDANTDPRGGVCNPVPGSADECYNGYGLVLELGEEPARYTVRFSDLAQDPIWGYRPEPSVMDREHIYSLTFQVNLPGGACTPPSVCADPPPELSFDVWIDDLHFIER